MNDEPAFTAVLIQRDLYHDIADELAERIAKITGVEIGEHSSNNDPWMRAKYAADEYLAKPQVDHLAPELLATPAAPAQPREAIDMGEDRDIQYAVKLEREFAEIERRHGLLLRVLMDIAKDCTSRAEAVEMAKAAIEADKKGG